MASSQRNVRNQIRPVLDSLDPRIVPAAVVDVTAHGSAGMANGAILQQCDAQPTGTGVIQSFVRVQATGVEQGYNTDARPLQFDENKSPQFTRSLPFANVPTVTVNGVAYRQFLLDINQKSSSPLLSLDELRVYVGTAPNLTGYAADHTLAGMSPLFDLDGAGDVTVKMDYRLNSGSGSGDVFVLIPDADFATAPAGGFLYLYSKFGVTWGANSGFEEWSVKTGAGSQGGGGSSSLSGYVYFDADLGGTMNAGDSGIQGIKMQLQGVNDLGQTVVLTATTDVNGFYSFDNLRAGTYSIFETTQPTGLAPNGLGYQDGANNVGTINGTLNGKDQELMPSDPNSEDGIISIMLGSGQNGLNYNFGKGYQPAPPPG
jgi:hypothetical protein